MAKNNLICLSCSGTVMPEPGGPGGPMPPQYLADHLTRFQPEGGRLFSPITTGTTNFFHLPPSLHLIRDASRHSMMKPWPDRARYKKEFFMRKYYGKTE